MRRSISRYAPQIIELWLFYKIGVINTVVGISLYSILIFVGINLYFAQIVSHIFGVIFNYFMFTRHVFTGVKPSILKYIASYIVAYFVGLAFLAFFHQFFSSPYVAGILAAFATSMISYIMLKFAVFRRREPVDGH